MAQEQPKQLSNPLYKLIQDEKIKTFNQQKASSNDLDLSGGMFRGLDLREIDADGVNFSNVYFRGADLRGVDFRRSNLEGASLADAKISGTYFPDALDPAEIRLSNEKGTRMRYRTHKDAD